MAQINNQAILQKIIDELGLYPGLEAVPTELAEKILPVFQVNTEEITIKPPFVNVVKSAILDNNLSQTTLYTTPATGKFYLTNLSLSSGLQGNGGDDTSRSYIDVVIGGATVNIATISFRDTATGGVNQSKTLQLNFQNPILIDKATAIRLDNTQFGLYAAASIMGYTED